jgi:hypothetical protein
MTDSALLQAPLRDIHGIDPVPWWPPAPGWWLVAAGLLALLVILWRWWPGAHAIRAWIDTLLQWLFRPAWQRAAARELASLRQAAGQASAPELAAASSALIRRIAMARHGRAACAGLHGQAWLDWLSAHDPGGFDWGRDAEWLIRAPFAPPDARPPEPSPKQLEQMITAAERWVTLPVQTLSSRGPAATDIGGPVHHG